jgi:hypothetical protein
LTEELRVGHQAVDGKIKVLHTEFTAEARRHDSAIDRVDTAIGRITTRVDDVVRRVEAIRDGCSARYGKGGT